VEGKLLSQHELLSICYLLFRGGLDTVVAQLGHIFVHLAGDPALRRRIREKPDDVVPVVEEMLRFYAIPIIPRTVTQDVEFAGCPMKKGNHVLLPSAAASRDPKFVERPDEFDPDRPRKGHLSFGSGVHTCPGMHLARLELRTAIQEWHRLIPDYRIGGDGRVGLLVNEAHIGVDEFVLEWP
jgi:cytochrome P450